MAATLSQKPAPFSGSFNPNINALESSQLAQLPFYTSHLRNPALLQPAKPRDAPSSAPKGTFEDFFGSNPFSLRADQVEEYRASLYGKLAHNAAGLQASQKLQQSSGASSDGPLPVPAGFRPAFFSSPTFMRDPPPPYSPPQTPLSLAGKDARDVASSDLFNAQTMVDDSARSTEVVASLATQTLFRRMASAFLDAFAGTDSASSGRLSPDKVASVLSGQSRLAVVPNDSRSTTSPTDVDALGSRLGSLSLDQASTGRLRPSAPARSCSFEDVRQRWIGGFGDMETESQ